VRNAGVGARIGEREQHPRADERCVDRQEHRDVVRCGAQARNEPGKRRPDVGSVVLDLERKLQLIVGFAEGAPLVTRLAEDPPRALGEGRTVDARERLRRAEAPARASNQQHSCQSTMRHSSL
jgi:hypothetical protein